MRTAQRAASAALVAAAALGLVAVNGFTSSPPRDAASPPASRVLATEVLGGGDLAQGIAALQARLGRLPRDHASWAGLGAAYVQQARLTADPSYYRKAQGAFATSLRISPDGNADAVTGLASLAAARHDFRGAERFARRALAIDPYDASTAGVLSDALVELGRYGDAEVELQRMLDLKPGVPSLTRASYFLELHGRGAAAAQALRRAQRIASTPSDQAYALYYLGELAFNAGDLRTAAVHYAEGLRTDPTYLPLLAGRAKVRAARGETAAALRDYADVVRRLPQPSYVIEYGDLLASLGRHALAREQYAVARAEQQLFAAAGVDVDLELALFDADHGQPARALAAASTVRAKRRSVQVEDVLAWALHVNGRDREALGHADAAARTGMSNALFAFHRGMIEASLGHRAAAMSSLRDCLRTNPHFSPLLAPQARRALVDLGRSS